MDTERSLTGLCESTLTCLSRHALLTGRTNGKDYLGWYDVLRTYLVQHAADYLYDETRLRRDQDERPVKPVVLAPTKLDELFFRSKARRADKSVQRYRRSGGEIDLMITDRDTTPLGIIDMKVYGGSPNLVKDTQQLLTILRRSGAAYGGSVRWAFGIWFTVDQEVRLRRIERKLVDVDAHYRATYQVSTESCFVFATEKPEIMSLCPGLRRAAVFGMAFRPIDIA